MSENKSVAPPDSTASHERQSAYADPMERYRPKLRPVGELRLMCFFSLALGYLSYFAISDIRDQSIGGLLFLQWAFVSLVVAMGNLGIRPDNSESVRQYLWSGVLAQIVIIETGIMLAGLSVQTSGRVYLYLGATTTLAGVFVTIAHARCLIHFRWLFPDP